MKERTLLYVLIVCSSFSDAIYYGQKSCSFDDGICDGWTLRDGARIVNTTTHNFTASGNFTQNGSFVYTRSTSFESQFLELPTYYRLCQISLAVTLNMTSLEVFPQSNREFYFYTATQDESLLPWSLVNISIPSYTTTLTQTYRGFRLWFIGVIADDFTTVGEGTLQLPDDGATDFYVGLDDVTLTYCLPCNFDDLSEPGNLMLTISPAAVSEIQLVPLVNISITLQAFSSNCNGQRFLFQVLNKSMELQQSNVFIQQLSNDTASLTVMFSNYNIFSGGAQNFTINVGAGIQYSNYLGYGEPPMTKRTITLTQPGLISTRVPPDPIYFIPEEPINYQLQAHSVLAPNNILTYDFAGTDPLLLETLLYISKRTGLITGRILTRDLASLSPDSYVNVTINDSANNKMIKITIPVLLGQLAPRFLDTVDDVITVRVRENTLPHSTIANFRVMDPNNDTISISFGQYLSGPEIFSLNLTDHDHHQLILNSPLDYESFTNYSFTIEAAEVASTSNANLLTSTATVIVQVLPVNEYPPVIMPTTRPIQLVVPETVVGSVVLQVMATDQDAGNDGILDYRITRVAHNNVQISPNLFVINYTTGVVTITELLEEGLYNYTITVLVTDMGSPSMTATMDYIVDVIGYQKDITCDFSINSCSWVTEFREQNSQTTSLLVDYNTNSSNTGAYVFISGDQLIGGTKIFLTLEGITTSVINEIFFVYQLNDTISMVLQTSSHTIWSSTDSPGEATTMGDWRQVRLYARSLHTNGDSHTNLQFVAIGSSRGFAAVDDITVQVKSHCNYEALNDPENFSFDLPSFATLPLNEPTMIPSSLTLTECRNEPIAYSITVSPDHLMPYITYSNDAINVLGLNSMVASNGTIGKIMVSGTITAADLFEGSRQFTYNDTVNFVVISLQKCVVTKECSFSTGLCDWQSFSPITLTTASAVGIPDRSSGQLVSGDYSSMQNLTLAMSTTINGSYCRISFYYYATSGIILSIYNPAGNLGELWASAGLLPEQWNPVNVHISYSLDPRVEFELSFRVSGVGLLVIDDITLHPCIDCETGCRNTMCPAGEFYIFDGCQPCPTGHYCLGGTSSAIPCAAGTFNDAERSTSSSACRRCPIASFSTSGSTDCSFNTSLTCALGSYPNISDGVATCVLCQPGNACPNGGILWVCPEGFIASMPGATSCTMCPAGYKCPTTSSDPMKCADDQYSLEGEMECHDCPEGFTCNGSTTIPQQQPTMKQALACSEDDSSNSSTKFIIIIVVIAIVSLLIITLMTCYIVRLRYQIVTYKEQRIRRDNIQYAARDGNITLNSTYQPYKRNSRLSKDGLDLANFSTYDDTGDVMENEGYQDEEVEMTEQNTVNLLVTTDGVSQF